MHFSTIGRSALALASVVTRASAAMNDATRLPNMAFWWAASPPKRRPFLGVAGTGLPRLGAQGPAPPVELRERPVGLGGEDGTVVVGGLLGPGGLDAEGHPAHGREDGVDGDDADRR